MKTPYALHHFSCSSRVRLDSYKTAIIVLASSLHQQSMKICLHKMSIAREHIFYSPFLHKGNGNAICKAPGFVKPFFIERPTFLP